MSDVSESSSYMDAPVETKTCRNCAAAVAGDYCATCRQPVKVERLTFRELWFEFMNRVLGFDGKFPRTLRDLTLRPGLVVQKFIEGNRVRYYSPVTYFFLVVTILVVGLSLFDVSFLDIMASQQLIDPGEQDETQHRINTVVYDWMGRYLRAFSLAIVPIVAWVAGKMFRKSQLNFLEQSILPLYITGHSFWITILAVIMYKVAHLPYLGILSALITMLLYGLGYSQLMNYQGNARAFVKGIIIYLLGSFIYIVLIVIGMITTFILNPELV